MKLLVKRLQFLKAIQTTSRVVPSRTTKDILKNVHLVSTANQITLTGTDGEIGLRVEVSDVVSADGGECLLPTGRLISILGELECEEIKLDLKDGKIKINGGNSEFLLLTEDAKDFPPVPAFTEEAYFAIKAADLRLLIRRTIFACDFESSRYALGGIQVEIAAGRAIFAATDSRRLAVDSAACQPVGPAVWPREAPVIPGKTMKLLSAIAEDNEEVRIAVDKNGVAVKCGLAVLTSQFVQGRFPDWRKVMPESFSASVDLVVGPFFGAIRQAMILRNEASVGVEFGLSKGQLRLQADVADMGASKVDLPIAYDGEPIKLMFDPKYFADVLKALDSSSQIQLKLISKEDPALIEMNGYKVVLMPISRD